MKRFVVCLAGGLAFTAAVTSAQGPPASAGLADMLRQNYNGLKGNVIGSAEKMPEADFASKPSSMPEVRTFAQLFGHIANAQYNQCSAARGVPNPSQGVNLEEKTSKADVTKFLADVFAFCDPAFQALTDQSALELVTQGQRQVARGGILVGLLGHSNEMYGTAVAYLRAKNLVPPSTENAGRRGGGPGGAPGRGGRE
jgi:hypothetical protein